MVCFFLSFFFLNEVLFCIDKYYDCDVGTKRQIIMQKAPAEVRLWNQFCFRPAAWAWELGGVCLGLNLGQLDWGRPLQLISWQLGRDRKHLLPEIQNPRKGGGWGDAGVSTLSPPECMVCALCDQSSAFHVYRTDSWSWKITAGASSVPREAQIDPRPGRRQGTGKRRMFLVLSL